MLSRRQLQGFVLWKGVKRKNTPTCWPVLSLAASPTTVPGTLQRAPPGFFSSILTSAILRDFSERPRPDFLPGSADHCFIWDFDSIRVFAYCYLRSCRGAYSYVWSLGAAWFGSLLMWHKAVWYFPRTCFSISSCWAVVFLCSAGGSLSSL